MSGGLAVWCLAVWCLVSGVWCLVFGVWRLVHCIKSSSKHGYRCRLWMQIQPRGAGDGVFGVRGHGLFERGYKASSTHVTRHTKNKSTGSFAYHTVKQFPTFPTCSPCDAHCRQ